jgi:hypothetical protein
MSRTTTSNESPNPPVTSGLREPIMSQLKGTEAPHRRHRK